MAHTTPKTFIETLGSSSMIKGTEAGQIVFVRFFASFGSFTFKLYSDAGSELSMPTNFKALKASSADHVPAISLSLLPPLKTRLLLLLLFPCSRAGAEALAPFVIFYSS